MDEKPTRAPLVSKLTPRQLAEHRGDTDLSHRGTLSRMNLDRSFRSWLEAVRFVRTYLAVHDESGINGETCGKLARILLDAINDS